MSQKIARDPVTLNATDPESAPGRLLAGTAIVDLLFDPGLSSSTPIKLRDILMREVTPEMFSDPVDTDDGPAIQKAVDAVKTTGGIVRLLAKTYQIASEILHNGVGCVTIQGTPGITTIKPTSALTGANLINVVAAGAAFLAGIVFDGDAANSAMSAADTGGLVRVESSGGHFFIDDCFVRNSKGNGIRTRGDCPVSITGCYLTNIGRFAVYSETSGGARVINNQVDGANAGGIYVSAVTSKAIRTAIISGNVVKNVTDNAQQGTGERGNGIHAYNCQNVTIVGNNVSSCEYSAIRVTASEGFVVSGNSCFDSGESAIFCEFSMEHGTITGNLVRGYGWAHNGAQSGYGIQCVNLATWIARGVSVTGNTVVNGHSAGIYVEGDCTVTGNFLDSPGSYGILVGTNSNLRDDAVRGNTIQDRYAPAWTASTVYRNNDRVTANGNVYVISTSGTSASSGSGPSGTGSSISDGTCVWSYVRASVPLQYGILASINTTALGVAALSDNLIFDYTQKSIWGFTYGPPVTPTAFVTGSKVYLDSNYPGINSTDAPITAMGGSRNYEPDTGAMKYYDAYGGDGSFGAGWRTLKYLQAASTWDPASIDTGSGVTSLEIACIGAALGDFCLVAPPYDLQGLQASAWVSSAGHVKIRLDNNTGVAVDLSSGSWKVRVLKPA